MNSYSGLNHSAATARKLALAFVAMGLACTSAFAAGPNSGAVGSGAVKASSARVERIAPANNDVVGSAHYLIPDGSNVFIGWGSEGQKWYYTEVEAGKTYVVDVIDPYADAGGGSPDGIAIFDSDGTSAPPELTYGCSESTTTNTSGPAGRAPAILNYGERCIIRTYVPDTIGTSLNKRPIYIEVLHFGTNNAAQIRVRESTIYGRWTTNGYDFHIELQNTSSDSMCVQILLYPNSGLTYTGSGYTNVPIYFNSITVPAFGANKLVVPNGTTSGVSADKRGTMRLHDCGSGELNTAALNVSTYAFSPGINQYLYFFSTSANHGTSGSF